MLYARALPLVRGGTDRYRALADELKPHLGEYERLNQRYEVSRHAFWINHPRDGSDIGVSVYDISPQGLAAMRSRRWDQGSGYDRWWLGFVEEVNGVDMTVESPHRAPPERVFAWTAQPEMRKGHGASRADR